MVTGYIQKVKSMLGFEKRPYKVGLVLSGGGARGFAHAGAIKALAEVGIVPDIVAGVSAGSVAAVMYAAGITPERMVELFHSSRFSDFAGLGLPREGFFSLDRFRAFIEDAIPYNNIEDLPVPTVIGATNLDRGCRAMFERGPLGRAVAASCCIPVVFKPVRIDGERYVDGGVLHNLPAWTIRDRCKYLIAVNCSPLTDRPVKNSIIDIALRSYELMARMNAVPDLNMCDVVIRTDEIARHKAFDLNQIERVFESGYRGTVSFLRSHGLNADCWGAEE